MHLEFWGAIQKLFKVTSIISFTKVIWNDILVERYIIMLRGQVLEFCKPGFPVEWTLESNSLLDV